MLPSLQKIDSGFFLLDKPAGLTSSDLVQKIRKNLKLKKIGHTGTLDKFARGLLILPFGEYTSFSDHFLHSDKEYEAEIVFGKRTDSGDPDGEILEEWESFQTENFYENNLDKIKTAILEIEKTTSQIPPKISALKIGGIRQSTLFRQNISFESKERKMQIYNLELQEFNSIGFKILIGVSSGTYIRKLILDLSEKLNFPMYLKNLTRTKIGNLKLENAHSLEDILARTKFGFALEEMVDFPKITVSDSEKKLIFHGGYFPIKNPSENFLLYDLDKNLLAWASKNTSESNLPYIYRRVFKIEIVSESNK